MIFILIIEFLFFLIFFFFHFVDKREEAYDEYKETIREYNQVTLKYKDFINYYNIDKSKWRLDKTCGLVFYKTNQNKEYCIFFNKEDYFLANRWISDKISKNDTNFNKEKRENLINFLNSVQEDINEARLESEREREKAAGVFVDIYKNLTKNEGESELDAFINAVKADS